MKTDGTTGWDSTKAGRRCGSRRRGIGEEREFGEKGKMEGRKGK